MKNLISLVTGGTSGVGKSVALALAAQGSQVIVAGRDLIKTNAVCEHITRVTKNKSVFPMIADLSSRADIDTLVSIMYAQFPRLDILVNREKWMPFPPFSTRTGPITKAVKLLSA